MKDIYELLQEIHINLTEFEEIKCSEAEKEKVKGFVKELIKKKED
ncbi:hypothetical protein ACW4EZ_30405 (plasmid) [Bacillus toyonensis]|nr:hypothetical protein [Bacillus toyonensis]MCU5182561.1 hypothetical protein [Bacillus toyonensis]MCU5305690.1 hypothetical protein [Bacillus toyonensis]MDF9449830.1 hypothetical protein [Bacillus toyonensis]MDG1563642.1 hypothetical protein [Bacillus toyonensis]